MPKRSKKKAKSRTSKSVNGFESKPPSYQPSKKELEADIRVPVSFDRMVDALFASDQQQAVNS